MKTKQALPTLIELANNALVWSGKNEKTINIKITIPTARMIVDADQKQLDAMRAQRDDLLVFIERYVDRFGAKHADETDSAAVKEARALIARAKG